LKVGTQVTEVGAERSEAPPGDAAGGATPVELDAALQF